MLFVAHRETPEGTARTRRLFTTLNKYAKPVTTSEIIALDEDDAFAVTTRTIVNQYDGLNKASPGEDGELCLVQFEGGRILRTDDHTITTIQTLYKLVSILSVPGTRAGNRQRKALKQSRPPQSDIDAMCRDHEEFWEGLREHVPEMRESLGSEPAKRIVGKYRHRTGGHILFRPVGQETFARALRILLDRGVPIQQGIKALASTELMLNEAPWNHVMWDPGRNSMNRANMPLTESLLLHMVHENPLNPSFRLEEQYQAAVGSPSAKLADIPKGQPAR